jgi:hypothetical protein
LWPAAGGASNQTFQGSTLTRKSFVFGAFEYGNRSDWLELDAKVFAANVWIVGSLTN